MVEMALTLEGYEVIHREDGVSGLEAALALTPDLIVLDIALPGMDGWEVLRSVRTDSRTQNIPVIIITAHDTAESRSQADLANADAFVGKPFDLNQLRDAVNQLIAGREVVG